MKICKNCSSTIQKNQKFCISCGNKINNKKNFFSIILFILIFVLIILIVNKFTGIFNFSNKNKTNQEKYTNMYEHIVYDYKTGKISINEYLNQLYCLEFDSENINEKYKKDSVVYLTSDQLNTLDFIDKNYKKLDKNIVKKYMNKKILGDVKLKSKSSLSKSSNFIKLSNDNIKDHCLDKAKLSAGGKFILWYTDSGNDAITEDNANTILDDIERAVDSYEKIFGIKYSYEPYVDNKYINSDYTNASKILEENNISFNYINSAMSIYAYDIDSDSLLAYYSDKKKIGKILNRIGLTLLNNDGVINYPFIAINTSGFNNTDNLKQIVKHELFHHMQYLNCMDKANKNCVSDLNFIEASANYASAILYSGNKQDTFLSRWSRIYYENTSNDLPNITDKAGSRGYALFPYLYSYSLIVNDSSNVFNYALTRKDAYDYINNVTSSDNLKKVINNLAKLNLSQHYENNAMKNYDGKLNLKDNINENKKYKFKIGKGSIDYFELNKYQNIEIKANNYEYLTFMLIGVNNDNYTTITEVSSDLKKDIHDLNMYNKVYLVVTNGNLSKRYNYEINAIESKEKNDLYNTSYNNYNIEIDFKLKMKDLTIETISKGVVDELHQKEFLDVTTNTLGATVLQNQMYIDYSNGYSYTQIPKDYQNMIWQKDKNSKTIFDLGMIKNKLINNKSVKKVSDNHYKVKLTRKELKSLMKSTSDKKFIIIKGMNIDVYMSNDDISMIKYDFSKVIPVVDQFNVVVKFSNYNNAGNVEIPSEVIDSATEK